MISLPCPPTQWTRFSSLLDQAIDLPEGARATWLSSLSGDDVSLRPWLARVLGTDTATGADFLRPLTAPNAGFIAGQTVGPYRLEALLGQGGMGEVWRARRLEDGPQREVALKLPHAELLSGPFRQRFTRERDVLAALSHPHIAQLYDAGLSAEGHPYLALELVEGQPITDACRATGATLHHRLDLVRQVLDALSYAHQRLIVHRDIKPSNVLVTPGGGVKLLDFGIAKLLRPTGAQDPALTQAARLATPAYAAPEQFGDAVITVATDLFSVGVLLFELCTGHRPFASPPIGPHAQPAPLASQRADATASGAPEGKRLASRLRGDIDAVIAQALALSPADRYPSAEAFARDLQCCRDGLPVSARRIGWPARARKFAARNRTGVLLATVLALALAGGTGGIAWQAQRTEREATRATAIKDFLVSLFKEGDPRGGGTRIDAMTARQLLDIGADRADTAFANDPATEIELLNALGDIYDAQDDSARAERMWTRRLDLARGLYGPADPLVVESAIALANSEAEALNYEKAQALLEQVRLPILHQYGAQSLEYAEWLANHARALRATHGGRDEMITDTQAAIAIFATKSPISNDYVYALNMLSLAQYGADQYAASLATCEKMHQVLLARPAPDAMQDLMYVNCAARQLAKLGRLPQATALYAQAEAQAARTIGRQSEWYLIPALRDAEMVHLDGDRTRATAMFTAAISGIQPGPAVQLYYGAALAREGRAAESLPFLEPALAEARQHTRDEETVRSLQGLLGDAFDQLGRTAEARALLLASRNEWLRFGAPNGPRTLAARERWARFLLDHGDAVAAETELRAVQAQSATPTAPASLAAAGLARIALAHHDLPAADSASARAMDILSSATLQYDVRARIDVWSTRAEVLRAAGRTSEAGSWAQKAITAAQQYDAPGSPQLARARALLSTPQ